MFVHANTYKKKLDKIENDEEELKKELRKVRSCYNTYHNLSSGFVISFFLGLFGYLLNINNQDIAFRHVLIGVIFLTILVYQILSVRISNFCYEKMKLVEAKLGKMRDTEARYERMKALKAELNEMKLIRAELEKMNSAIQPNPKK